MRNATDSLYDVQAAKGQNWDEVKHCHAEALGMELEEYLSCVKGWLYPSSQQQPNQDESRVFELEERLEELEQKIEELSLA